MANLGKDDAFPIPWTAVLTVAGIVGVYLTFTSLTTSRPPGGAPATPDAMGFADVEARLWQDPLAAVGKHKRHPAGAAAPDATRPSDLRAPTPQGIHTLAALQYLLRYELGLPVAQPGGPPPPSARVLVLPVMLHGGPYPENTEARLRQRHAVLSALSVAGFVPRNGEHLGFVDMPWRFDVHGNVVDPVAPSGAGAASQPAAADAGKTESDADHDHPRQADAGTVPIPYEWWDARQIQYAVGPRSAASEPAAAEAPAASAEAEVAKRRAVGGGRWDKVLVMWLDDERFEQKPLTHLQYLVGRLLFAVEGESDVRRRLGFGVIGPRGSGTLRAMWHEALGDVPPDRGADRHPLNGLNVYSATATADEASMGYGMGAAVRKAAAEGFETLEDALRRKGVALHRTIGTDWQLAREMVRELELRGVDAASDPIALVGEWDTLYARGNVFAFASAASGVALDRLAAEERPPPWPTNITRHTYLRGIDGVLPDKEGGGQRPRGDEEGEKAGTLRLDRVRGGAPEAPEGLNQADYLRRLAGELEAIDARRRRDDPSGRGRGIRAIGVMAATYTTNCWS